MIHKWEDKKVYNAGIKCYNTECSEYVEEEGDFCEVCQRRNQQWEECNNFYANIVFPNKSRTQ